MQKPLGTEEHALLRPYKDAFAALIFLATASLKDPINTCSSPRGIF
jgi:hypothetical protein